MIGPTSGMILQHAAHDGDRQGVGHVEDRPQEDVEDYRHERNQQQLAA